MKVNNLGEDVPLPWQTLISHAKIPQERRQLESELHLEILVRCERFQLDTANRR